jgi:Domain of unknown function (DUF4337)
VDPSDLFESADRLAAPQRERFRSLASIAVAAFAALLAIASVGGGNASDDVLEQAIAANDAYAFFQAKNIRQTDYEIAADGLRIRLDDPKADLAPETRASMEATLADYEATIARYDSEPDPSDPTNPLKGEGKTQLLAQARDHEAQRDEAQSKANLFDLGSAALQIAIVVMSVAILVTSRALAAVALAAGVTGTIFVLDGFIYLVPWPS